MHKYSYEHFKERRYPGRIRYKPVVLLAIKNKHPGSEDVRVRERMRFVADTGAMVTRFNTYNSHYFFSTDIGGDPDYTNPERIVEVKTGAGGAKRYLHTIDEIQMLDIYGNVLTSFCDVEIHCPPPNSNVITNLIGMNLLVMFKKIEINEENTTIYW